MPQTLRPEQHEPLSISLNTPIIPHASEVLHAFERALVAVKLLAQASNRLRKADSACMQVRAEFKKHIGGQKRLSVLLCQ